VELLHADFLRDEPGEHVFRHGRSGPLVLLLFLLAPLGVAWAVRAELLEVAAALPWFLWLVLGPVFALGAALYALVLVPAAQVVARVQGRANWAVRISPAGLALNLRSYQNAHFPQDGPTIVRFAWNELARAREARDVTPSRSRRDAPRTTRWLQLELTGVDTAALEALVRNERERRGPERRFLGVRSRSRFGHAPVFVPAPGVVHAPWLGRAVLRALEPFVPLAETLERDASRQDDPEERLKELIQRGERLRAVEHARATLGLSLSAAQERVKQLGRRAA
jgi:hypothetical protein